MPLVAGKPPFAKVLHSALLAAIRAAVHPAGGRLGHDAERFAKALALASLPKQPANLGVLQARLVSVVQSVQDLSLPLKRH